MRYTITRDNAERDLRALRGALSGFHPGVSSSIIPALQELADSIEEQVKPKVTEPTEWGSVVRARLASFEEEVFTAPFRWQRHGAVGGTWVSEPADDLGTRYYGDWSHLRNVEVLRVGIGEPTMAPAQQNAQVWQSLTGRVIRFCMRSQNCRMADGHDGGCQS